MLGASAPLINLINELKAHDESNMRHGLLGATAPISEMAAHGEAHMTGGMLGATLQHLAAQPVSEMAAHGEAHMTGGMLGYPPTSCRSTSKRNGCPWRGPYDWWHARCFCSTH